MEIQWFSEEEICAKHMPGIPKNFIPRGLKLLIARGDLIERTTSAGKKEYAVTPKGNTLASDTVKEAQAIKPPKPILEVVWNNPIPESIILKHTTSSKLKAGIGFKTLVSTGILKSTKKNGLKCYYISNSALKKGFRWQFKFDEEDKKLMGI